MPRKKKTGAAINNNEYTKKLAHVVVSNACVDVIAKAIEEIIPTINTIMNNKTMINEPSILFALFFNGP